MQAFHGIRIQAVSILKTLPSNITTNTEDAIALWSYAAVNRLLVVGVGETVYKEAFLSLAPIY